MNGLTIHKTITISLTADQWELYDKPGRNNAAIDLNESIEKAVNDGLSRRQVIAATDPVFKKHEDLGARDSEPLWKLEEILDAVFK